jgi:calcineurin-like phosphoesterase family protein
MIRWWYADTHFSHPNIQVYCSRPQLKEGDLDSQGNWVSPEIAFQRAEKMNADLIRDFNMRIKKEDTAVCVGDFSCRGGERGVKTVHHTPVEILDQLNGTHVIIEGNHDSRNGVKPTCSFMECEIAKYRVGVQHRPLLDEEHYNETRKKVAAGEDVARHVLRDYQNDWVRRRGFAHARYCREMFDFMICGHVHNAWKVKKIAGMWHVNVGVDVNRYMPINDTEVVLLVEKAEREGLGV